MKDGLYAINTAIFSAYVSAARYSPTFARLDCLRLASQSSTKGVHSFKLKSYKYG
ncbi:MAG: hypothetical protein M3Y85_08180 [Bacteroidota bacterium]|nr:hypothetical protein [Bacteroidota bacterium]